MSFSIGPIVGMYAKPKYRVISAVLGEDFSPDGFDIYIDLNTIVSVLSTASKFLNSLPFSEDAEKDIVSSVLGIVKHWKDYTRNKYDDVRIILLLNEFEMRPLPEQSIIKTYLVPYMNKFKQDRFQQMVYYWNEAMKKIEVVLKYIPNSYLIKTNFVDSYVVPMLLSDEKRTRLIMSGNAMFTSYNYIPNAKVIYSRFSRSGNPQLSDPLMICQKISKIDDDIMTTFCQNKVFYNLLQAIIGDTDRGIMGITQLGITNFANELLRAVEQNRVPKNPKSIEVVFPAVNKNYHEYLKQAYPLIDVETHQQLIPPSVIEKTKGLLVDLIDIDGLSQLSVDGMNLLELL